MHFVTVQDAAKILSAYEESHGRRAVSPRRVRYFLDIGRLAGIRLSLDDRERTKTRGRRAEILVQIPEVVLQFQKASAA
jgi:hypothetical protein